MVVVVEGSKAVWQMWQKSETFTSTACKRVNEDVLRTEEAVLDASRRDVI